MKNNKIKFVDWFNPCNKKHLVGLKHFLEFGEWPENFVQSNVEFDVNYVIDLYKKIVNSWINLKLPEKPNALNNHGAKNIDILDMVK